MSTTCAHFSDVAFAVSVKAMQMRKSSREIYERVDEYGAWQTRITPDLAEFIEAQTSIFLATANAEGQPCIQHCGGPTGFLSVLNDKTLGFADFSGDRHCFTRGNLAINPRAYILLIDYVHRRCVTIWGEVLVVEDDAELAAKLAPAGYTARAEQTILFSISAWGADCPLPQRLEASDLAGRALEPREAHQEP